MKNDTKKILGLVFVLGCAVLPFVTTAPRPEPVGQTRAEAGKVGPRHVADSLPKMKPQSQIKQEVQSVSSHVVREYVKPFKSMPAARDYRASVEKDHHGTPRVLDGFAYEMANEMTKAKKSLAYAKGVFERLKACALDKSDNAIEPVKAVCAQNAAVLSEIYPESFKSGFKELHAGLEKHIKASLWR